MSLDISILQVSITIIKVINISHHLPKSPCVHSLFFEVDNNCNSYFRDEETSNLAKKKKKTMFIIWRKTIDIKYLPNILSMT